MIVFKTLLSGMGGRAAFAWVQTMRDLGLGNFTLYPAAPSGSAETYLLVDFTYET